MVLICLFLCRSVSLSLCLSSFSLPRPLPASLSFCILNCPYSASFPFLALRSILPGPLLYLIFHFLPASQSRPSFSFSFSSGLYFCAPDVPPVANIVFLPPPLDMAKEAICALLAILGHFFGAFSPLDLFFALAPFRPASSAFPRFPPSRLSSLSASAHPVSSSIPTYSISRPSAQVNIIPAWFPSLSETPARAVFIFRASVALDFCHSSGPPAVTSSPVFATARCHCPRLSTLAISCSRAPAAIVPSQEPESRDAGVSRNAGIGSHLAATGFSNGQEAVL